MRHKHFITRLLDYSAKFYNPALRLTVDEQKLREKSIELARLDGNERILDVGCGTGSLDLMVAEIVDGGSICGIDISPKMVEVSKEKAEKSGYEIDYRVGSSTKLPYSDNEFDVIFTSLMYHHLDYEEKLKTLREIHRVLKKNGRYISVEFGGFPSGGFHKVMKSASSSGILHGLYPSQLIEKAGFHVLIKLDGPLLARHHETKYRVLMKEKTFTQGRKTW
jgi:ubiquinone/menaquinone biosynthesis C-methylase UbiE